MYLHKSGLLSAGVFLVAMSSDARFGPPSDVTRSQAREQVAGLADTYVKEFFQTYPVQALVSGAPDAHPDQLGDHSLSALERWQEREDQLLTRLKQVDLKSIEGTAAAITYRFLLQLLEGAQGHRVCRMELWNVSPTFSGWQAELGKVAELQVVKTADDRQHAVTRFRQLGTYLDTEIENLREGLRLGYSAPRNNVEVVIGQMDALLAAPLSASPFVQMARSDGSPGFRKQLEQLETTTIRPAIKRYRDFLKTTYLPAARTSVGVSENRNGAACYAAAVNFHATVKMSAQQIHELGLSQVEKIHVEMREIGGRAFGTDDPVKLMTMLRTDPKYRFKSRDELIEYAERAVDRARQALPSWFGRLPKAPVMIEPYPPYLEKSAPGGESVSPTADGKPGKYLINAYNPTEQSRAGLESTAFHETYPGHHLQGALALERGDLHPISRYFYLSGFAEGWGLYAERLADEMKLFSSDVDRVGMLAMEGLRAARLVVDSGLHVLGWPRDRAVEYLLANTTESRTSAEAEIDRYIAVPGQATAYMIGNLEIRRLCTEAELALGSAFEIREFHDLLLSDGTLPLSVLREKVQSWIAKKRG